MYHVVEVNICDKEIKTSAYYVHPTSYYRSSLVARLNCTRTHECGASERVHLRFLARGHLKVAFNLAGTSVAPVSVAQGWLRMAPVDTTQTNDCRDRQIPMSFVCAVLCLSEVQCNCGPVRASAPFSSKT